MRALNKVYRSIFILFLLISIPSQVYSEPLVGDGINQDIIGKKDLDDKNLNEACIKFKKFIYLSYYLYIDDFIKSFIQIPTSNVLVDSSTISSRYLAGRAPIYNVRNKKVGVCSASFLCMQNADDIFTDIANYLTVDNGLIISWLTPSTLLNLELDSIVHSMVTECIVTASTKVGFNPFYGATFNMVVSSDDEKIYFKLLRIK